MAGRDRKGVRGPRGPQGGSLTPSANTGTSGKSGTPAGMNAFQRASFPVLRFLSGLPRWVLVVVLAGLLVLGVIQTGPLAWLGVLILAFLGLFFLWLLAHSWPVTPWSGRILRLVIVLALFLGAYLKAIGRL